MIVLFNNRSEVNGLPPLPSLHESLPDVQTIIPLLNTTMKQDGGFTQSDLFWKKKVERKGCFNCEKLTTLYKQLVTDFLKESHRSWLTVFVVVFWPIGTLFFLLFRKKGWRQWSVVCLDRWSLAYVLQRIAGNCTQLHNECSYAPVTGARKPQASVWVVTWCTIQPLNPILMLRASIERVVWLAKAYRSEQGGPAISLCLCHGLVVK